MVSTHIPQVTFSLSGRPLLACYRKVMVCSLFLTVAILVDTSESDEPKGSVNTSTQEVVANENEQLNALDMLAAQMRGNYERIVTWKGVYLFSDRFRFPGEIPKYPIADREPNTDNVPEQQVESKGSAPLNSGEIPTGKSAGSGYWEITRGVAEFSLDQSAGSYHLFYQPQEPVAFIDVATGDEHRWKTIGDSIHWVFTPAESMEFDIAHKHGPLPDYPPVDSVSPSGGRIIYRRTAEAGKHYTRVVDVRDFFTNGSSPWWESLELYGNALRGKRSEEEQQHVQDNLTILFQKTPHPLYTTVMKYSNGSEITTIYDGRVGFNVVDWERKNGNRKTTGKRKITYREVSGIFIPETADFSRFELIDGEMAPNMVRSFRLQDMALDVDIPEEEFGTNQFGLTYGERMLDEIENRLMVYDDKSGFIPADEFELDPSRIEMTDTSGNPRSQSGTPRTGQQGSRVMLFVINGAILLIIIGFFLYRKFKA